MKKKKSNLKSNCCNADIKVDMAPDFYGDNPKTMIIGTCCYICNRCNQACDVHINIRKTWAINPATKIKGDERGKFKEKLTKKEIEEIRKNEDF
jgi:L-lactate utilization protein LutB